MLSSTVMYTSHYRRLRRMCVGLVFLFLFTNIYQSLQRCRTHSSTEIQFILRRQFQYTDKFISFAVTLSSVPLPFVFVVVVVCTFDFPIYHKLYSNFTSHSFISINFTSRFFYHRKIYARIYRGKWKDNKKKLIDSISFRSVPFWFILLINVCTSTNRNFEMKISRWIMFNDDCTVYSTSKYVPKLALSVLGGQNEESANVWSVLVGVYQSSEFYRRAFDVFAYEKMEKVTSNTETESIRVVPCSCASHIEIVRAYCVR